MKLIFLGLIAVLLNCGNSIGFDLNQNGEVKTKIVDLNDDILYIIFDELEFSDLLNTAEAFPELSGIFNQVFRRKYPHHELEIKLPECFQRIKYLFSAVDDRMVVYDIEMVEKVLKSFGHFFQTLTISAGSRESSEVKYIYRLANEYCSESLKRLELINILENTLNAFTVPFKAVEEVHCQFKTYVINETQPWNQLFPQLRRFTLNMYVVNLINANFIDCTFPHLEYLHLKSNREEWARHPKQIRGFIKKNPTIRYLNNDFPHNGWMEILSVHLPQLENLTISNTYYHLQSETIHFANVKNFISIARSITDTDRLLFPRLESLELRHETYLTGMWINFFKNHKHLTRLYLIELSPPYEQHAPNAKRMPLNEFTTNLPNLMDVNVQFPEYDGVQEIIDFLEGHEKLQKFRFHFQYDHRTFPVADLNILLQRFGDKWNIRSIETFEADLMLGLFFEKKDIN